MIDNNAPMVNYLWYLNKIKETEADKARSLVHGLEYQLKGNFNYF